MPENGGIVNRIEQSGGWCADDLFDDERGGFAPSIAVDEHVATDTGILDADGNTIWRAPNPLGFGKDDEW